MGVLTDFFLASPEELRAACRGWKEPLATRVKRQGVNPFTKKPMEILTTAPDEPFAADTVRHLDLSRFHPVDLKGLGTSDMEELMRVALGASDEEARAVYDIAIHGPPDTDEMILCVPPALVARLARMSPTDIAGCGGRWHEVFESGLRSPGERASDYLTPLVELARRAMSENRQMFMWMCP